MKVFKSRKSEWYFDKLSEGNELLSKGNDSTGLSNPFYVDNKILVNLSGKYKIKEDRFLSKVAGDDLLSELKANIYSLNKPGGRFVSLISKGDNYRLDFTGIIQKITEEKNGKDLSDSGLKLVSEEHINLDDVIYKPPVSAKSQPVVEPQKKTEIKPAQAAYAPKPVMTEEQYIKAIKSQKIADSGKKPDEKKKGGFFSGLNPFKRK